MAFIPPVPLEALDPELRDLLRAQLQRRTLSSDYQLRIWAHRPQAAAAWLRLLDQLNSHSTLDERLRELVRLKIASKTNCTACQIARKSDEVTDEDIACLSWSNPRFTPREQAALRYAELFVTDYLAVDEQVYAALEAQFSVEQIVDLQLFAAMMLAGGRMTYVQRAYESQEADLNAC